MLVSKKKIEVYTGCNPDLAYKGGHFKGQIKAIFEEISDSLPNGGSYDSLVGRYQKTTDMESYKMEFVCDSEDVQEVQDFIKKTFRKIRPEYAERVCMLVIDVGSDSFTI